MSISCRIVRIGKVSAQYSSLLGHSDNALVYVSPHFLAFLERATNSNVQLVLAEKDGQLIGALPFASLDRPGVGTVINSLPWWGSHGSIVIAKDAANASEVRRGLLRAFVEEIERVQPLSTTIVLLPGEQQYIETYNDAFVPTVVEPRVGQITRLPVASESVEADLLGLFHQKTRNLVRKSCKMGFQELVVDEQWAWDFLAETHKENISALGGSHKPRDHFEYLAKEVPAEQRRLSLAMKNGEPVAAMLTLTFNRTVEYITPAIRVEHRSSQPLSFLIFRGMIDAVHKRNLHWNWGGTWITQHSLHHFKSGFGASDQNYSYLIKASAAGISSFRRHRARLGEMFPYFYTFPYGQLSDVDSTQLSVH